MKSNGQRGSLLLIAMGFVIVLSTAAVAVLSLGRESYRASMRNEQQSQARGVAESEMEYLYYKFKLEVMSGNSVQTALENLAAAGVLDNSNTPTTIRTPFFSGHSDAGWQVRRSLIQDRFLANERFPGTTKEGSFTYLVGRIELIPPVSNVFGTSANVRIGRRFMTSSSPIFQNSIFFEGDLEFTPGGSGTTTINGNVVANGNIYMASESGGTIVINDKVRYLKGSQFNKRADGVTEILYNPNGPTPPVTLVRPSFADSQANQLEVMDKPENLLGIADVRATALTQPKLFGTTSPDVATWTASDLSNAINNVYRTLIVPPPRQSTTLEFPLATLAPDYASYTAANTADDPVLHYQRAAVIARLHITVETDGTTKFWIFDPSIEYNSDATIAAQAFTDVTSTFVNADNALSAVTNFGTLSVPLYTKNVYDRREQKPVQIIEINVGRLKAIIDAQRTLNYSDPANIHLDFRGLLYVNLKGASAGNLGAVRLINGASVPYTERSDPTLGISGFSVATNGGIYVKGSYNTTQPVLAADQNWADGFHAAGSPVFTKSDGTAGYVPAMLMGDAITLLSSDWDDAKAALPLANRIAAAGVTTLNAGLLTGNIPTPSTPGSGYNSGGAQNLVRYLENWNGRYVNFFGSLGRLFTSTKFTVSFGGSGVVYSKPSNRSFAFDKNIVVYPPPATPKVSTFTRGDFFTW